MWGLLVGAAIGVLQLPAVNKLGRMVLGGKKNEKLLGILLFIAKMAAITVILYFISTVSLAHLIWTAGGMLLGLVSGSVYMLKRRSKNNGDGKNDA
ncbi:MAG: hypothetical protein ACM3S4_07820 [Burkholderiales bacterium]